MLPRNKNLDLVFIRSDGDRNIAVALAAIQTIILFANKTIDRQQFSGVLVPRIKTLSVRSESWEKYVTQET